MIVLTIRHRNVGVAGFSKSSPFQGLFRLDPAKNLLESISHFLGHHVVEDRVQSGGEVVANSGDEEHPVVDVLNNFVIAEVDGHEPLSVERRPTDEKSQNH